TPLSLSLSLFYCDVISVKVASELRTFVFVVAFGACGSPVLFMHVLIVLPDSHYFIVELVRAIRGSPFYYLPKSGTENRKHKSLFHNYSV
ncbi:hypothetical protein M5D96_001055, partial [Drosophila gunungcola]